MKLKFKAFQFLGIVLTTRKSLEEAVVLITEEEREEIIKAIEKRILKEVEKRIEAEREAIAEQAVADFTGGGDAR